MHFDIYEPIWFKLVMMIDTVELHFDNTSLIGLDLDKRSQGWKNTKISAVIISQSWYGWNLDLDKRSQGWKKTKISAVVLIWMEFGILLKFDGIYHIFILSHPFNIQGREPYLYDFF